MPLFQVSDFTGLVPTKRYWAATADEATSKYMADHLAAGNEANWGGLIAEQVPLVTPIQPNARQMECKAEYDAGMAQVAALTSGMKTTYDGPKFYERFDGKANHHWLDHGDGQVEPLGKPVLSFQGPFEIYNTRDSINLWRTKSGFVMKHGVAISYFVPQE